MKKVIIILMSLLAMMVASLSAKAQEITITLYPGWNWISYPNAEMMDIVSALGDFSPMQGDIINSQYGTSSYTNGHWRGSVTHFMPGWGYMYYSVRTEYVEFTFAQPSSNVVATATPTDVTAVSAVVGGMVMLPEGSHVFLRGVCWGTEPEPTIDDGHTSGEAVAGSQSITLTELMPSTTYYVRAYAVTDYGLAYGEELSFTTEGGGTGGGHAYVDLGLPSGLLWATCNVGADTPEEYGDYFAWGETQPKDYYGWDTYQYYDGSSVTKYTGSDGLTTLLPEDDAATANWGNDWRMPTQAEWQELYQNTTHTWTTQNGVNGRLFTASNGSSLFLPAAGNDIEGMLDNAGIQGDYWSSSFYTDDPYYPNYYAWCSYFDSDSYIVGNGNRYCGQSVRAVRSSGQNTIFIINVTANPAEGGEVSGGGTYQEGVECTLTATPNEGYTFANWTEDGAVVSANAAYTFTVDADRTLVANFTQNGGGGNAPTGAINGLFSVSTSQQVYFSQGNLQYQASTDTWKFAENQYDYVGSDNSNISSTYDGWIDLFGWGTSGWNSGNTYYHPWDSSISSGSTYGPPGQYNLTGSYANADWGVYNPISNGGSQTNQWRTLTQPEWNYVFNTRTTTSGIRYAKANVNNVNGVILLPDDWSSSTYSLSNTNSNGASYSSNTLTASQWSTLEQVGAVFLPAAGYRYGTSVHAVGSRGDYWSASCSSSLNARDVYFLDSCLDTGGYYRYFGFSVRLARVAE